VEQKYHLRTTKHRVQSVFKEQLGLSYRKAHQIAKQGNTERVLVLRQQYAKEMLPLLEEGTRIINVDESWLNGTTFIRKMWAPKRETC